MKWAGFSVLFMAALCMAPAATAQDDELVTGSWDIYYDVGGEEHHAMISVARNSDGRLVGLWTQFPDRERTNLVDVTYENGVLTLGKPVVVDDKRQNEQIKATLEEDAIEGTIAFLQGTVEFEGTKRGGGGQDRDRRGRGERGERGEGRGGGFDVDQIFEAADANGDGLLQKSEAPERMQQFFDMMDTNGDGNVSKEETEEALRRFRGSQN